MESASPHATTSPTPPGADHARSCAIATFITVAIWVVVGAFFAIWGVPLDHRPTDPPLFVALSMLGFAFCSGQGAAVTGFIAMKQRQNPLWILPAIVGALLGVAALFTILGLSFVSALHRQGLHF